MTPRLPPLPADAIGAMVAGIFYDREDYEKLFVEARAAPTDDELRAAEARILEEAVRWYQAGPGHGRDLDLRAACGELLRLRSRLRLVPS